MVGVSACLPRKMTCVRRSAPQRSFDQFHPVIAEIHVRPVHEHGGRTESAAGDDFVGVGAQLVLDLVSLGAIKDVLALETSRSANIHKDTGLADVLTVGPI